MSSRSLTSKVIFGVLFCSTIGFASDYKSCAIYLRGIAKDISIIAGQKARDVYSHLESDLGDIKADIHGKTLVARSAANDLATVVEHQGSRAWESILNSGRSISEKTLSWGKELWESKGLSLFLKKIPKEQQSEAQLLGGLISEPKTGTRATWKQNPIKKLFQFILSDGLQWASDKAARSALVRHAEKKRSLKPANERYFSIAYPIRDSDLTPEGIQKLRSILKPIAERHTGEVLVHGFPTRDFLKTLDPKNHTGPVKNNSTAFVDLLDELFPLQLPKWNREQGDSPEGLTNMRTSMANHMAENGGPVYVLSKNKTKGMKEEVSLYNYNGVNIRNVHFSPINGVIEFITGHPKSTEFAEYFHEKLLGKPIRDDSWWIGAKRLKFVAYIPMIMGIYMLLPPEAQAALSWMSPLSIALEQGVDVAAEFTEEKEKQLLEILINYHPNFADIKERTKKNGGIQEQDFNQVRQYLASMQTSLELAQTYTQKPLFPKKGSDSSYNEYKELAGILSKIFETGKNPTHIRSEIESLLESGDISSPWLQEDLLVDSLSERQKHTLVRVFVLLNHPYYSDLITFLLPDPDTKEPLWIKEFEQQGLEVSEAAKKDIGLLSWSDPKSLHRLDFLIRQRSLELEEYEFIVLSRFGLSSFSPTIQRNLDNMSPELKTRIEETVSQPFYRNLILLHDAGKINDAEFLRIVTLWLKGRENLLRLFKLIGMKVNIEKVVDGKITNSEVTMKDFEESLTQQIQYKP